MLAGVPRTASRDSQNHCCFRFSKQHSIRFTMKNSDDELQSHRAVGTNHADKSNMVVDKSKLEAGTPKLKEEGTKKRKKGNEAHCRLQKKAAAISSSAASLSIPQQVLIPVSSSSGSPAEQKRDSHGRNVDNRNAAKTRLVPINSIASLTHAVVLLESGGLSVDLA